MIMDASNRDGATSSASSAATRMLNMFHAAAAKGADGFDAATWTSSMGDVPRPHGLFTAALLGEVWPTESESALKDTAQGFSRRAESHADAASAAKANTDNVFNAAWTDGVGAEAAYVHYQSEHEAHYRLHTTLDVAGSGTARIGDSIGSAKLKMRAAHDEAHREIEATLRATPAGGIVNVAPILTKYRGEIYSYATELHGIVADELHLFGSHTLPPLSPSGNGGGDARDPSSRSNQGHGDKSSDQSTNSQRPGDKPSEQSTTGNQGHADEPSQKPADHGASESSAVTNGHDESAGASNSTDAGDAAAKGNGTGNTGHADSSSGGVSSGDAQGVPATPSNVGRVDASTPTAAGAAKSAVSPMPSMPSPGGGASSAPLGGAASSGAGPLAGLLGKSPMGAAAGGSANLNSAGGLANPSALTQSAAVSAASSSVGENVGKSVAAAGAPSGGAAGGAGGGGGGGGGGVGGGGPGAAGLGSQLARAPLAPLVSPLTAAGAPTSAAPPSTAGVPTSAAGAAGSSSVGGGGVAAAGGGSMSPGAAPMAMPAAPPMPASGGPGPVGGAPSAPLSPYGSVLPPSATAMPPGSGGAPAGGLGVGSGAGAAGGGAAAAGFVPTLNDSPRPQRVSRDVSTSDLELARSAVADLVAASSAVYPVLQWAVAVGRGAAGVPELWVATNEGNSYIPVGVFIPRSMSLAARFDADFDARWVGWSNPGETAVRAIQARGDVVSAVATSWPHESEIMREATPDVVVGVTASSRPAEAAATTLTRSRSHRLETVDASLFLDMQRADPAVVDSYALLVTQEAVFNCAAEMPGVAESVARAILSRRWPTEQDWVALESEYQSAVLMASAQRPGLIGIEDPQQLLTYQSEASLCRRMEALLSWRQGNVSDVVYAARCAGVLLPLSMAVDA